MSLVDEALKPRLIVAYGQTKVARGKKCYLWLDSRTNFQAWKMGQVSKSLVDIRLRWLEELEWEQKSEKFVVLAEKFVSSWRSYILYPSSEFRECFKNLQGKRL